MNSINWLMFKFFVLFFITELNNEASYDVLSFVYEWFKMSNSTCLSSEAICSGENILRL